MLDTVPMEILLHMELLVLEVEVEVLVLLQQQLV
jgi:hypothetical protein